MELPNTIVVATDFSELAEKATAWAVELAAKLQARVVLVHAWMIPLVTSPEVAVPLPAGFIDDLAKDAQRSMDAAVKRHTRPGVALSGTVVCADPRDGVIEAAEQAKAGLIVLGTHGRRGLKRVLLGSVAENVVRTAHCPVMVVR